MNFKPQKRDDPDVSLTPLIDVVFLLLIFFMVSTTFDQFADLKIELPESTAEVTEQQKQNLEIVIDAKGNFFINRQQVVNTEFATLKKAIEKSVGDKLDIPVVIRADANTPYQSVITVLDAAGQAGLTKISMPTTHSDSE